MIWLVEWRVCLYILWMNNKLRGAASILEDRIGMQNNLDKLENWSVFNKNKLNNNKYISLSKKKNQMHNNKMGKN